MWLTPLTEFQGRASFPSDLALQDQAAAFPIRLDFPGQDFRRPAKCSFRPPSGASFQGRELCLGCGLVAGARGGDWERWPAWPKGWGSSPLALGLSVQSFCPSPTSLDADTQFFLAPGWLRMWEGSYGC